MKKRLLFYFGVLITGLVGVVSNYTRTNYSKGESLLIPTAHADLAAWEWTAGNCADSSGCGSGGCSGAGGSK